MNSQKSILVTGATKGIGLGITRTFLKRGDKVFGVGRSIEIPEELKSNGNFVYQAFSVASPESVEQF